ncbi:hypothetical protein AB0C10_20990 [Microbispora amethystogenes]|uniref:hypothetical protein n=1 Tax=Microbispora amethystogenes TaxID=1427754 RepID=UPI0033C1F1E3
MGHQSAFIVVSIPQLMIASPVDGPIDVPGVPRYMRDIVLHSTIGSGIAITVAAKQIFLFDFAKDPQGASLGERRLELPPDKGYAVVARRLKVMNAFALCLHGSHLMMGKSYQHPFKLAPEDLLHPEGGTTGAGSKAAISRTILETAPVHDQLISGEVIESAVNLLDQILKHPDSYALEIASLINDALVASTAQEYAQAVVMAWSACEFLLERKWLECCEEVSNRKLGKALSRKKREYYEGRDYSASLILEILWFQDVLGTDLYESLTKVRKMRNDWIHGIKIPDHDTANLAVVLALGMYADAFGISIVARPGVLEYYLP